MPEWKLVLDEGAFEFYLTTRGAERRILRRGLDHLKDNPMHIGLWQDFDEFKRPVEVELFGKLWVSYWSDVVAKEVRIVRIKRRTR